MLLEEVDCIVIAIVLLLIFAYPAGALPVAGAWALRDKKFTNSSELFWFPSLLPTRQGRLFF